MGRQDLLGWMGRRRGSNLASVEPATGRQLVDVGAAAPEDVQRAVQRASDAQQAWAATPYDIRATVLRRAADLLVEHQVELEDWVVREARVCRAISPARWAPRRSSVRPPRSPALHWVRFCRRCSRGCLLPAAGPGCRRGHCTFQRSPHTCCAGARPRTGRWQRGRTQAGSTNGRLRRCRLRAPARRGGSPNDVLHVLPGGGDIGRELVTHPDVPVIAFTGSVNAGREVARLAAGLLKRVHLELAGNSTLVVLEDADLEQAVTAAASAPSTTRARCAWPQAVILSLLP